MKNNLNVGRYLFGLGSFNKLGDLLAQKINKKGRAVFLVDEFFSQRSDYIKIPCSNDDLLFFIQTSEEPTTEGIDAIVSQIREKIAGLTPDIIVGIGGGTVLDTAKAVSNMLTNPGKAADYQGWDLVKNPGVYKIGIPTLSGTGAEASRTCVLTNKSKGIKLGMNSDHSVFDQLILDPDLTKTVNRDQYFYSGMDAYIHCIESLTGSYRNALADSFSRECVSLCREIFLGHDMMSEQNREKLMVASYLGGAAIASTFVGVVHPLSAALSVVYGTHHCVANCIVMNVMDDFYPDATSEFRKMVAQQNVKIPRGITHGADATTFKRLYESCIVHEKPLFNALGADFRSVLTPSRVEALFRAM
jgi:3-deoxy-alpha-D-manno-octulosonate 8-oxidase